MEDNERDQLNSLTESVARLRGRTDALAHCLGIALAFAARNGAPLDELRASIQAFGDQLDLRAQNTSNGYNYFAEKKMAYEHLANALAS